MKLRSSLKGCTKRQRREHKRADRKAARRAEKISLRRGEEPPKQLGRGWHD